MVRLTTVLIFALVGYVSALAQPVPKLDSLSATWFQRGTTNEITLKGDALASVGRFFVGGERGVTAMPSAPAVNATGVTLEASAGGLSVGTTAKDDNKSLTARLVVAADAPLGARELRVASPDGVSNPLTINVSDLPEITEREPNHTTNKAQWVTLPAGISGVVRANAESDFFRFHARAGERLIFDVQANRFGSPLDPTLVLRDTVGKELARSEDAHGLDPFLDFTTPAEADYIIQLHDLRFQGGGDYRYRIVAGALPYLEGGFPFGGRRGSSVEVTLRGVNLDGQDKLTVAIASDAPLGSQDVRLRTPRGSSNPRPFEAGDLPEQMEDEPNNAAANANAITVPLVVNGRIGEPKDVDTFRFKAVADQKLVIEVRARMFGSPLDALLTLSDTNGAVLQRNDDADGPDARIEFDAKRDTEYLVSLRDLTDRGGERFGYRLSIRPPNTTPDFTVRVAQDRHRIHAGGHTAVRCEIERRNGFDGVVRVTGGVLPAGVSAGTLMFAPEGPNFGWLVLSATPDAEAGHFAFIPMTIAELAGRLVTRAATLPTTGFMTVLPAAPFSVEVTTLAAVVEQNAGGAIDVNVTRRGGFTSEVKVLAEELPGVSFTTVTVPAGQSHARLNFTAAYNSESSIRPVMVRGEANVAGTTANEFAAAPVPLTVTGIPMFLTAMLPGSPFFRADPFKLSAGALPAGAKSEANLTEFVVKVDRRGLTGEIALALEGLPAGVTATVNNIPAGKNDATINLAVGDKAEAGKEYPFNVVGSATYKDRTWRQKTQVVTLAVAAPEKETAAVGPPAGAVPVGK